jgi:hypothetical protein
VHLVPQSFSCLRPWLDQLSPSYAPESHLCNVHLTCDVYYVSIIQFLDHHICSLVLNPIGFTLSTCSTLSTLVSPLIELSSKHQNSQEIFQTKGSNMLTSVPNGLLHLLKLGNTSIYSPLSKTSYYGPIAPFLHTRTVFNSSPDRPHKNPNGYKNVIAFNKDLRTVCPMNPNGPRYQKSSQTKVLLTLHIC